ncbi:MAG: hypothetical protein AB8C46_20605 [Burkholderiaceae bacterium]
MSRLRLFSLWLAALTCAAALWWPEQKLVVAQGAGAILMFDITQSMNVEDVAIDGEPVTRLEMARQAALAAVDELPCGTALGTGIFSAHRALLLMAPIEVCKNRLEIRQSIRFIGPAMAWHGNSEVAKAWYASLKIAAGLDEKPAIVFLSDGHEAPPVSPLHRPIYNEPTGRGEALMVGIGGDRPAPIPKTAPSGQPLGFWKADEVMQIDRYQQGRGGSAVGEKMVELDDGTKPDLRVGGTPGTEHLSALREPYLQLLASETASSYVRLHSPDALMKGLEQVLVMPGLSDLNARRLLAAVALLLVALYYRLNWLN